MCFPFFGRTLQISRPKKQSEERAALFGIGWICLVSGSFLFSLVLFHVKSDSTFWIASRHSFFKLIEKCHNAANHRQQKAARGTSGAFCCPSAFALLGVF